MKKKNYLIGLGCLIAVFAISLVAFRVNQARSVGGSFAEETDCTMDMAIATSTLRYLTPGAGTTTLTCYTRGTSQIDFNIFEVASSTLTDLRWRVEYSHSTTSPTAAATYWYPETTSFNSTTATTSQTIVAENRWIFASSTSHRIATSTATGGTTGSLFDPDTTGVRRFSLKDIAAVYTRIVFYIPTGSTASTCSAACSGTTALGDKPSATSTNAGIHVQSVKITPIP